MREHQELLAADVVVSADGAMWRVDEPSLTVASRGLCGLELTLTGAGKDLHSGRHGGGVANPLHAMAALIASLHDADGRVAVAGFYDGVRELSAGERAAMAALALRRGRLSGADRRARRRSASRATPRSSASGPGRRSRSTACGAAIRDRARRR